MHQTVLRVPKDFTSSKTDLWIPINFYNRMRSDTIPDGYTRSVIFHELAHFVYCFQGRSLPSNLVGTFGEPSRILPKRKARARSHLGTRSRCSRSPNTRKSTSSRTGKASASAGSGNGGDDGGGDGDGDSAAIVLVLILPITRSEKEPSRKPTHAKSLVTEELIKTLFQILLEIIKGAITIATAIIIAKLLFQWGLK
jgi:hypothetical protein